MPVSDLVVEGADLTLTVSSRVALAGSTFTIPANAVTAVIGPNGSGKSTLLNAISGLLSPVTGSLLVFGEEPERVRRRVAYVLQSIKVNETLPVTVREVVTMGRYAGKGMVGRLSRTDRAAVMRAMERTAVVDLASRSLHELSGGERQRVFVAQGLAQDHDLLLLDEPLTGLDLPTAAAIREVISDERHRHCAVVFTTHDLGDAMAADWVLLLAGRVVASGPPAEVLTPDHLANAYGLMLGPGLVMDDPAHRPAGSRHVHLDRALHVEAPGSELHPPSSGAS
jgi:iron complex transport system ATP-binding protein